MFKDPKSFVIRTKRDENLKHVNISIYLIKKLLQQNELDMNRFIMV